MKESTQITGVVPELHYGVKPEGDKIIIFELATNTTVAEVNSMLWIRNVIIALEVAWRHKEIQKLNNEITLLLG